ncbi:MAG: hypothetical protein R3E63_10745 [Pseudomonadales bacterium]
MSAEDSHKALFSYGHMRAHYTGRGIDANNSLLIEQFIRPENLTNLREALLQDQAIFSECPNTYLQSHLSPISRQCLWELQSGIMIRLLENITLLDNLLPDTHCRYSFLSLKNSKPYQSSNKNDAAATPTLVLHIDLDSGGAKLIINTRQFPLQENVLQFCYWQHQPKKK